MENSLIHWNTLSSGVKDFVSNGLTNKSQGLESLSEFLE